MSLRQVIHSSRLICIFLDKVRRTDLKRFQKRDRLKMVFPLNQKNNVFKVYAYSDSQQIFVM